MVKIATWNVNSIKARLPNVLAWLEAAKPDVALLQETKCLAENFPRLEIESAGYKAAVVGQKSYNGVAILARQEPEVILERLPGDESDEQARYLEARVDGLRVATIYLPNGNPVASDKFGYKLDWMARLRRRIEDCCPWRSPSSWAATTTSFRKTGTATTPRPGPTTPCSSRRAAPPSGRS